MLPFRLQAIPASSLTTLEILSWLPEDGQQTSFISFVDILVDDEGGVGSGFRKIIMNTKLGGMHNISHGAIYEGVGDLTGSKVDPQLMNHLLHLL